MKSSDLQFNIIYTLHTPRYLVFFVHSLLRWTDCRYRLIANACSLEEVTCLQDFCKDEVRLDFMDLEVETIVQHGEVLDRLQQECEDDYFCFMDSDILATGRFMDEILAEFSDAKAVTSCLPIWAAEDDITIPHNFKRLHGCYARADNGIVVGCTYFSVYDNSVVNEVRELTGIGFQIQQFQWLTPAIQEVIRALGMEKFDYDTGIVLSLLMTARGAKISHKEPQTLCHLGGVSQSGPGRGVQVIWYRGYLDRWAVRLRRTPFARPAMKIADLYYGKKDGPRGVGLSEAAVIGRRLRKRSMVARYYFLLLRALTEKTALPVVPYLADMAIETRVGALGAAVTKLHRETNATL
jgi:hypothetical protein